MQTAVGTQELCESRGGRPGPPVPNSPYGLRGRKATLDVLSEHRSCVKVEVDVPNSPHGLCLCGRKATFNDEQTSGELPSVGSERLKILEEVLYDLP